MYEHMDYIDQLIWTEKRFGFMKTIGANPNNDRVTSIEGELLSILNKHKEELNITIPVPRVRTWITDGKLNFVFYDRKHGKRVLLGDWLSNRDTPYER